MTTFQLLTVITVLGVGNLKFWGNVNFYSTRSCIVHLDQWRYEDVARECVDRLDRAQVAAVLVSAPNDHAFRTGRALDGITKYSHYLERYQPVSFSRLDSASGTFGEFKEMVQKCNEVNIRVYVDVVLGHTTSNTTQESYAGSEFNAANLYFPDFRNGDFLPLHFCSTESGNIEDYSNQEQLMSCREDGWVRLDTSNSHVHDVLVTFLQKLQLAGVSGFRVAYADMFGVYDLEMILDRLLPSITLNDPNPVQSFVFLNVPHVSPDRLQGFANIAAIQNTSLATSIESILDRKFRWKWKNITGDSEIWRADRHQVTVVPRFLNNTKLGETETYWMKVMVNMVLMSLPKGIPMVYSGWKPRDPPALGVLQSDLGPPSTPDFDTLPVTSLKGETCGNRWDCIHRQLQITNMALWRNVAGETPAINVVLDEDGDTISFGRKGRSFFVMAIGEKAARGDFNTTLRAGFYCDVLSGSKHLDTLCTGDKYRVYDNHFINILGESRIYRSRRIPAIAIHEESRTVTESEPSRAQSSGSDSNLVIV